MIFRLWRRCCRRRRCGLPSYSSRNLSFYLKIPLTVAWFEYIDSHLLYLSLSLSFCLPQWFSIKFLSNHLHWILYNRHYADHLFIFRFVVYLSIRCIDWVILRGKYLRREKAVVEVLLEKRKSHILFLCGILLVLKRKCGWRRKAGNRCTKLKQRVMSADKNRCSLVFCNILRRFAWNTVLWRFKCHQLTKDMLTEFLVVRVILWFKTVQP